MLAAGYAPAYEERSLDDPEHSYEPAGEIKKGPSRPSCPRRPSAGGVKRSKRR
jgi:hypothetical protein